VSFHDREGRRVFHPREPLTSIAAYGKLAVTASGYFQGRDHALALDGEDAQDPLSEEEVLELAAHVLSAPRAAFYPYFSSVSAANGTATCSFGIGSALPNTINDFGGSSTTEFGPLLHSTY
jgi:hypothetical protein